MWQHLTNGYEHLTVTRRKRVGHHISIQCVLFVRLSKYRIESKRRHKDKKAKKKKRREKTIYLSSYPFPSSHLIMKSDEKCFFQSHKKNTLNLMMKIAYKTICRTLFLVFVLMTLPRSLRITRIALTECFTNPIEKEKDTCSTSFFLFLFLSLIFYMDENNSLKM